MPTWNWDEAADSEGVVHQSVANTDHDDATVLKQGYDYANFSEITPTPTYCAPGHENSGTTAYDLAGTNDGTYSGPSLGNQSIIGTTTPSYDGVDDYMEAANVAAVDGASQFTVMFWLKHPGSLSNTLSHVVEQQSGTGSRPIQYRSRDDGNAEIRFNHNEGAIAPRSNTIPTDTWTHLACSYDASGDGVVEVYQNASLASSVNYTSSTQSSTGLFNISRYQIENSRFFDGEICDVRVYDTPLTQSQIQTHVDVVRSPGDWLGTGKLL